MNIVFFGSSNFAVASLKALISSRHKISCVVTQPDRQKGRGLHLQGTAIKAIALESGLKIYQPELANNRESAEFFRDLNADLFVVSAYGQILSEEILNIPKVFSINTHASLLPKYRGASPINWSLINGDAVTGVTIMKMTKGLDAGPVILNKAIDIKDDDNCITLEDKLSRVAACLLIDSLMRIENNDYELIEQDESKASLAPKLKKKDGLIDWERPAQDIYNLVRGCLGWPNAFTYYNGKLLKIYKARVYTQAYPCDSSPYGRITKTSKEGIFVLCGTGNLIIEELQLEGRRRMSAGEFIAGHKITIGVMLDKK